MEAFQWRDDFSVGVDLLDEQHKQIIKMIQKLSSDSSLTVRSETISELLSRLTSYAHEHFKTEEDLLEEHGYPGLIHQKAEHKAYRLRVVAFCKETMDYQGTVPANLKEFLHNWWVSHILGLDMKYRAFFLERNVT